jgi:hypothetical protein
MSRAKPGSSTRAAAAGRAVGQRETSKPSRSAACSATKRCCYLRSIAAHFAQTMSSSGVVGSFARMHQRRRRCISGYWCDQLCWLGLTAGAPRPRCQRIKAPSDILALRGFVSLVCWSLCLRSQSDHAHFRQRALPATCLL